MSDTPATPDPQDDAADKILDAGIADETAAYDRAIEEERDPPVDPDAG